MTSLLRTAVAAAAALLAVGTIGACSSQETGSTAAKTTENGITVEGPWVVEPAAPNVTGAFATISNSGDAEVTLVSADSPIAGMVQIHEYVKEGATEKMVEVEGGLPVPAGGSVELKPGSYHVMLMQLKQVPKPGERVELTFTFSDGTDITVQAPVRARTGMSAAPSMSMSMG